MLSPPEYLYQFLPKALGWTQRVRGNIRLSSSQLSDHRSKVLHLHTAINRNGGEAETLPLFKQVFHGLPSTHDNARDGRAISLKIPIDSALIDGKNIGQLTEFERLEAFTSCFSHPHELLFKSLVWGINTLGGESIHDGDAIGFPGSER